MVDEFDDLGGDFFYARCYRWGLRCLFVACAQAIEKGVLGLRRNWYSTPTALYVCPTHMPLEGNISSFVDLCGLACCMFAPRTCRSMGSYHDLSIFAVACKTGRFCFGAVVCGLLSCCLALGVRILSWPR